MVLRTIQKERNKDLLTGCLLFCVVVNIRTTLLAKGIHMNVLDIMRKHSHSPEVVESACRILNHVFEGR